MSRGRLRGRRVRGRRLLGRSVLAALAAALTGCGATASPVWRPPTRAELGSVHARLDALRAELGTRTEEVRIALEAPLIPGEVRARGAIAASPGRAVRMILVGPGGGTAADLWLDAERHRLVLPGREEVARGRRGDPLPFVPVDLLRAWFLEPLAGELLDATVTPQGSRAVLRGRDGLVFVTLPRDGSLVLERGGGTRDVERIRAPSGAGCAEVVYERPRTGVRASITCEARRGEVAERALIDPDGSVEVPR